MINRTAASQAKTHGKAVAVTAESSDFGQRLQLANTVGGFPIVSSQAIGSQGTSGPQLSNTLRPTYKQAIKMTQMPIFLYDNSGSHRVKKKETPKHKLFKALPGIQGVGN